MAEAADAQDRNEASCARAADAAVTFARKSATAFEDRTILSWTMYSA